MDNTKTIIEENINKIEKEAGKLTNYLGEHKGMLIAVGAGASLYLLGQRRGFTSGYIKGYKKCFVDIVNSTDKRPVK